MTSLGRIMARLALILGAALLTFGYSKCVFVSNTGGTVGYVGGGSSGSGSGGGSGTGGAWATTLALRDSAGTTSTRFLMGAPIRFDLEVQSRSAQSATLQFSDSQVYDFYVFEATTNRVVWRWSESMTFAQVMTSLAFPPLSSKSYSVTWNGILRDGSQLSTGSYRARGVIVADDFRGDPLRASDLGSNLVSFSVY